MAGERRWWKREALRRGARREGERCMESWDVGGGLKKDGAGEYAGNAHGEEAGDQRSRKAGSPPRHVCCGDLLAKYISLSALTSSSPSVAKCSEKHAWHERKMTRVFFAGVVRRRLQRLPLEAHHISHIKPRSPTRTVHTPQA